MNAFQAYDPCFYVITEGGRLTKELEYTDSILGKGHGSISQIIVQAPTPKSSDERNVLTRESLSLHLDAVLRATDTNVYLFNKYAYVLIMFMTSMIRLYSMADNRYEPNINFVHLESGSLKTFAIRLLFHRLKTSLLIR